METQRTIISSTMATRNTFSLQKAFLVFFLMCFLFFAQAQIHVSDNTLFYVSDNTSINTKNNEPENVQQKNISGKIYITKSIVVYDNDNSVNAQIVFVDFPKKIHLAIVSKEKETKTEKLPEPVKKSEYHFTSQQSESSFLLCSTKRNIAISNTNSQIKPILAKNANFGSKEIVYKTPVDSFIKKENYSNSVVYYFSIRPPPVV